jgi:SAM-dependent methyltransferase
MPDNWSSGDSYELYVGRWSRALAPRFLDWARLPAGAAVLDVGSGTGALSEAVVKHGARRLVGIDSSAAYVDHAAAQVPRGSADVRFECGDAQNLPFADETFDAVVSGIALNFIPNPARAAREMRRVVKPGGLVALYVWDYAGRMELMRYFWDAAVTLDAAHAAPLDEGVRFPICNRGALTKLFLDAGFGKVETGYIDQPTIFRDFDDYWTPFLGGQAPAPGYCMSLSENQRAALRDLIRARLPVSPDGSIALIARAWTLRATR